MDAAEHTERNVLSLYSGKPAPESDDEIERVDRGQAPAHDKGGLVAEPAVPPLADGAFVIIWRISAALSITRL
jgi:hypothetical protein